MTAVFSPASNTEESGYATYVASGAIVAGSLVKYHTTEGQVTATTAITDVVIGVSMGVYADGDTATIQTRGVAKVKSLGTISIGGRVMPAAAGIGMDASAGATAKDFGISEQDSLTGQYTKVRLIPMLMCPVNT